MYFLQIDQTALTEIFSSILDKHAPIKSKQIRGNQAPFINKSVSK